MEKVGPALMVCIQIYSAVPYFQLGDWRHGVYWLAAATLTVVVTW